MPLEFALRPRFRLDAPPAPKRTRPRLPPVVMPVAGYWLAMAALTYGLVSLGQGGGSPAVAAELGRERPLRHETNTFEPSPGPALAAAPEPEPEPEPVAWTPSAPPPLPEREELLERLVEAPPALPPPPREERVEAAASPREVAADEPVPEPAPEPEPAEPTPVAVAREARGARETPATNVQLPSCDALLAGASQDVDFGRPDQTPDLSRDAFASILENGSYLAGCGVPEHTALDICVAVQRGAVKGVSVVTRPADAKLGACVKAAVARLRFPYSPRLDVTRTRFEAER